MKRSGYSDSWDQFIQKTKHEHQQNARYLEAFTAERTTDEKLSMLVALASEHRRPAQQLDQMKRLRWAQARIDEERRMTIDPAAKRDYIDDTTRQILPPIHIHRPTAAERHRSGSARSRFWRELDRGRWRSKTVDEMLARCRVGGRRWAVAHPYGPPVESERIFALMADIKRMRDGKIELTLDEKFRLYTPRAAKQIAHMLMSRR